MIPWVSTFAQTRVGGIADIHIALRIDGEAFWFAESGIHGRSAIASRSDRPGSSSGHQVNDSVGRDLAHAAVPGFEIDRTGIVGRDRDGVVNLSLDCRATVPGIEGYSSAGEGRNGAIRRNPANAAVLPVRHVQVAGRTKSGAGSGGKGRMQRGGAIAGLRV